MNTTFSTTNWPYEHRFEVTVRGSLLSTSPAVWSTAIELMSCSISSQGKTPTCHYYQLSSGFLVVFDRRCVLVSSVERGLADASSYLMAALEEKIPLHATLTRRYPVGEDLLSLAIAGLDESLLPPVTARLEAGTIHTWELCPESYERPPQTLTLLMHGLVESSDISTVKAVVGDIFPEFLVLSNSRSMDCIGVTAVSGNHYLSIQRTKGLYASIEISVPEWFRAEELISQALLLFKPEIVAPIWIGDPLEQTLGSSCNNDQVPLPR